MLWSEFGPGMLLGGLIAVPDVLPVRRAVMTLPGFSMLAFDQRFFLCTALIANVNSDSKSQRRKWAFLAASEKHAGPNLFQIIVRVYPIFYNTCFFL